MWYVICNMYMCMYIICLYIYIYIYIYIDSTQSFIHYVRHTSGSKCGVFRWPSIPPTPWSAPSQGLQHWVLIIFFSAKSWWEKHEVSTHIGIRHELTWLDHPVLKRRDLARFSAGFHQWKWVGEPTNHKQACGIPAPKEKVDMDGYGSTKMWIDCKPRNLALVNKNRNMSSGNQTCMAGKKGFQCKNDYNWII